MDHNDRWSPASDVVVNQKEVIMLQRDGPVARCRSSSSQVGVMGWYQVINYMCMSMRQLSIYSKYNIGIQIQKCRVIGLETGRLLSLRSVQAGRVRVLVGRGRWILFEP